MSSGTQSDAVSLTSYDSRSLGPLFAVSDEGSAGATVVAAAYASAKARAFPGIDPLTLGVILDGERMTSAGEVPIGPDEYAALSATAGRLLLTTNVGVRANARYSQPLPEFAIPDGSAGSLWVDHVCAAFTPFIETPDRRPRPLTLRLMLRSGQALSALEGAVTSLESARRAGKIGPPELHRLSLLLVFPGRIEGAGQLRQITDVIDAAARIGMSEVAVDGELRAAARPRVSLPSLLNILEVGDAGALLGEARTRRIHLTYRYQLDVQTAARTIWTGLHTARTHGFAAGKYGMVPLALAEQRTVIELVSRWTRGWTAIPAFYVDTPLVTDDDVIDPSRSVEAACAWLDTAGAAGASLVLFDCPDRITPRRLLRQAASSAADPGVLTLDDVDRILAHARDLRMDILWSGGITAPQAFELAKRGVHGIFSTSSTARKIAVTAPFQDDPRLPAENEPTEIGVRRMHGVVQGGFLGTALRAGDRALASAIDGLTQKLLAAEGDAAAIESTLAELNERLLPAWRTLQAGAGRRSAAGEAAPAPAPVSPDAVRVFRGRKREELSHDVFLEKLGTVFMPITVQLQRLYGLTAYLPAVLPRDHPAGLPDEIALVFYRTQEAYHFAKRCVGGRAYSQLHDLVFDMPKSPSSFPAAFDGEVQLDRAFHLLPGQVDWQGGRSRVYVGTRKATLGPEAFRAEIAARAADLRKTAGLDAVILCATPDWLVCWTHGPDDLPPSVFADVTTAVLDRAARALAVSPDLSVPYDGLQLSPAGDFLNLQFPRV
jgi:hypothetical protein